MNETQSNLFLSLHTLSITGEPKERLSVQEMRRSLIRPNMLQLLTSTNDLMEALENIIEKVRAGRSEEIIDKIMPSFKFLETLQDECTQLQRWNAILRDDWVERQLDDIESGLQRTAEDIMSWPCGRLGRLGLNSVMGYDWTSSRTKWIMLRNLVQYFGFTGY